MRLKRILCIFGRHHPIKHITGLQHIPGSLFEFRATSWYVDCLRCHKRL